MDQFVVGNLTGANANLLSTEIYCRSDLNYGRDYQEKTARHKARPIIAHMNLKERIIRNEELSSLG